MHVLVVPSNHKNFTWVCCFKCKEEGKRLQAVRTPVNVVAQKEGEIQAMEPEGRRIKDTSVRKGP